MIGAKKANPLDSVSMMDPKTLELVVHISPEFDEIQRLVTGMVTYRFSSNRVYAMYPLYSLACERYRSQSVTMTRIVVSGPTLATH